MGRIPATHQTRQRQSARRSVVARCGETDALHGAYGSVTRRSLHVGGTQDELRVAKVKALCWY